jgi:hypothetical protein
VEATSADKEGTDKFETKFAELMDEEGYLPQKMFNVDETGLFHKMIPRKTCITKDEISLPGPKLMKDRLRLLLRSKASGETLSTSPCLSTILTSQESSNNRNS